MRIALDPGHGGMFPGAIGTVPFDLHEKDVTLAICLRIRKLLRKNRHQAVLTRNKDMHLDSHLDADLRKRAEIANRAQADFLISVHCSAFSDPNPEGIECWYQPGSKRAQQLAVAIQTALTSRFSDHLNRGVKPKDLLIFRHAQMPACHIETEFLTNPAQLEFLASEANQHEIAQAITDGLLHLAGS